MMSDEYFDLLDLMRRQNNEVKALAQVVESINVTLTTLIKALAKYQSVKEKINK